MDVVWDYCLRNRVAFKFLATRNVLVARNLKYTNRGGSSKFITIYPVDELHLRCVLTELNAELEGVRGPYVLSDLRWENGPLYVRYGGFARRYCRAETGELVPAIADPRGTLVPDVREPVFHPPDWVRLPEFLAAQLSALGDDRRPAGFPYEIQRALHFSNGGGVYVAEDIRNGRQVVLKEARPYAGLDMRGKDSVSRLIREYEFLTLLSDVEQVVNVYDHIVLGDHHFLVQEYVTGTRLNRLATRNYPLISAECNPAEIAEYTGWALHILEQVSAILDMLHERDMTFGDLHPNNIVIEQNDRVRLIDFEMAYRSTDVPNVGVGAPGFVALDGRTGPAADRYALGCLRLFLFLPLTQLIALDRSKVGQFAATVIDRFPVPDGYCEQIVHELAAPAEPGTPTSAVPVLRSDLDRGEPDWDRVRTSMVQAILASATPERSDRLFPGDVYQFSRNGLGFGYGAAGVLYALAETGHGRFPDHEEWLLSAVRAGGSDQHVGFYDGLHGISYVLDRLGRTEDAAALLTAASQAELAEYSSDLFGGLAGIGLTLLHFASRHDDPVLLRRAVHAGELLAERIGAFPPVRLGELAVTTAQTGRGGLLRGASGPALYLVRLFEHTGDEPWLDSAEQALAQDLGYCVLVERDRTVQPSEGWRVLPYLNSGSVGVGVVLRDYLHHRSNERLIEIVDGISRVGGLEFVIQPTLLNGRAGLIGFLSLLRDYNHPDDQLEATIHAHLRRLAWHIVDYQGHAAFPGEQLLRLSMDLGSGNAGILLAVHTALEGGTLLPFLRAVDAPPTLDPPMAYASHGWPTRNSSP